MASPSYRNAEFTFGFYSKPGRDVDLTADQPNEELLKVAYRFEAMSVIEDMMGIAFIDIFRQRLFLSQKFASISLYAGRLAFKSGGKSAQWNPKAANRILDNHQQTALAFREKQPEGTFSDWRAFVGQVTDCILKNNYPETWEELNKAAQEEVEKDELDRESASKSTSPENVVDPTETPEQD